MFLYVFTALEFRGCRRTNPIIQVTEVACLARVWVSGSAPFRRVYIHLYISISIAHPHRVFISTLYVVKPAFWLDLIDNDYCVVVAVFVFAPNDAWHWKKAYRQPGDGLRCVSEFYSTKRSDARLLVDCRNATALRHNAHNDDSDRKGLV